MPIVKLQKPLAGTVTLEVLVYTKDKELYDFVPLDWFSEDFFGEESKVYIHAGVDEKGRLVLGEPAPIQDW